MVSNKTPPIVSIVGRSGVGKTTFLTKLVAELKRQGYRVAVLKHHRPRTPTAESEVALTRECLDSQQVNLDVPGKDTWRHFQAGADTVIISGHDRMAMYHRPTHELTPDELVRLFPEPVDIVLTEGYTSAGKPAIEIVRTAHSRHPMATRDSLLAVVSDTRFNFGMPQFELDDAEGVAKFLESRFNLTRGGLDTRPPAAH
jgi:molybdopterin-guanine dinucleotide biosynthesis protein B